LLPIGRSLFGFLLQGQQQGVDAFQIHRKMKIAEMAGLSAKGYV
jgi:hypothetical protein